MAGSTRNPWDENYSTEGDSASGGKPWEQSYQEPEKPKRTWGEAIKDTGAQLAEGVNTTLGAIPSAVAPQSKAAGFFRDNAEHWRDKQSDVLKGRIAETDKRIQEAGKDGVMSQIGTAASEYWNDPAQAARLVATNLPSMAATLGTGAAAGFAAKGVAAARGLDAANKAALAAKYGTTTAAATNAALNAGGARGEAFEDLQKTALAQGMSPEQAEQAGVSGSILPGVVGGVAGAISGKIGLEKALLGQATTGAFMRKAGGAFGAELAGEQIEELAPKVATNYQVGQLDAARGLTDDVGRTMVETAIGSGPGAVVAGGAAGMRSGDQPPVDPATAPGAADPSAPVPPGAAPVEAPDLQATAPATEEAPSPIQPEAVEPAPLTPEQRMAELDERMGFIDQQAKANGWDKRLIDARDETRAELDALRGPAQTEPIAFDAPETDTARQIVKPSVAMGLDPSNGPLTAAAAMSVDSGLGATNAQFLGATGRDMQLRQTGPGVADESNVIDVQGRVVEDRAIGTPRRLTAQDGARESGAIAFQDGVPRSEIAAIPNIVARAEQLRGYDDAAQKASQPLALPAPSNLREGLDRIRAQRQEAARLAQVPPTQGANLVPQAPEAQQAISQQPQAGGQAIAGPAAAPTAGQSAAPGGSGVQAAGVMPAATDATDENKVGRKDFAQIAQPETVVEQAQNPGAQGTPAPGAQAQAPGNANWAALTPEQRRRARLEHEIATGQTNNGGVVASLRPSAIEKRKQELAAMGDVGKLPSPGPAEPLSADGLAAQGTPAPGAQTATAAEPEFTTIKTVYGDSVTVRTADLNSDKPRLRQYTKNGKSKAVPAIHRDNLDLTGDKRKARAKEDADNPFFNVITTKDGSTFASQAAATRELNRLAMGETHEVVSASEVQDGAQGFVIQRKLDAPAQETTYNGTRIYPTKVKVGDEVKSMWAAESPDNQRQRAAGERTIGGDSLHDTLEQAQAAAEREAKRDAEQQAAKAGQDAADKARLDAEEARKAANRPKSVVERRKDAILDGPSKIGQGTKRAVITSAVDNGYAIEAKMVYDYAAKKRDQETVDRASRAGYILGVSNENLPLVKAGNEAKARLKEGKYEKPEYRVYQGSDTKAPFREITKTEYDYAQELKAQRAAAPQPEAAQPATPQQDGNDFLPEGWTKSINGFTKRPVYRMEQGVGQPFAVVTQTEGMTYEVQIRHGDKQLTTGTQRGALSEVLAAAEAELRRMKQADSVTHADPGEKAEAATPAVVTDSLKKAARNEDTKPSEMRKWLVGKIDEAIAVAPEAAVDFLSFDVPGDGTFKVQNSQARLQEFRKKVMASPGFKDSGQRQNTQPPEQTDSARNGSGSTVEAIRNFLADGDVQGAVEFAKLKGVEFTPVEPRASMTANGKFKRVPASVKSSVPSVADGLTQVEAEQINQYLTAEQAMAEPAAAAPEQPKQAPAATETVAQPITRADVTAAQQQAGTLIGERLDAMTAGEVNTIARRFLPTMGVKPTVSKERNKAAVTDFTKVNPMAAADEFGVTLPADVRRALDAEMQGKVAEAGEQTQAAGSAKSPTRVTPQLSSNPEQFIKIAADSIKSLRKVDVDRVLNETPAPYRQEVASYIRDQRKDLADEVDDVMADIQPKAAAPAPAPSIPEGYKPAGEPFYRGGKQIQGYAPFAPGERVTMKESAGQSGVVESLTSPDDAGVFSGAMVKFDNGSTQIVKFDKLFETVETRETEGGNVAMFSRTGAQSANANESTSRAWYDRFVSLLPEAYRNDPHRREPLPAEDWNVQRAAEVHRKVEAINQQLRGENDRKGYGPISIDGLGNLQVSALQVSRDDLNGPIKALAKELGAGIAITNVRTGDIQALQDSGFVPETSLAPVADRIMGRPFDDPANRYAADARAYGTIMTYQPRGFPAVMFARDAAAQSSGQPLRTPAATIRAAITKAYGKLLGQLESKGLVTLTQTLDQAIEAAARARADKTGQSVEQARATLRASVKNSVADQTQTESFKRWFKDSKAVDVQGKPLVVYHGSPTATFTEFDVGNVGAFFSDRFDVAASYAGRYNEVEFDDEGAYTDDGTDQGVYEAYLAIRNPLVIDWGGRDWGLGPEGMKLDDWASRAKRAGHDGLVVENVVDSGWLAPGLVDGAGTGRVFVAFRPEQIKSATGNNGNFDPTDPDIRRSADGSIQGFFDPQTGQSFLIADNLTAEAAPGVLMHEVGIHMAADGSMKALFNRAAMMLKMQRGNPFIKAVQARMDAAGETSGEEAAAYIAEAYENDRANAPASVQRWLSDLLAAVKAWMFKKGIMGADRLTVADIAAVARANARSMARDGGATGGQGFGPAFSDALRSAPVLTSGDEKKILAEQVVASAKHGAMFSRSPGNAQQARARDAEHLSAVERGDMATAQRLVNEAAAEAGYVGSDYRMQHEAPSAENDGVRLDELRDNGLVPDDYWTHPQWYVSTPEEAAAHRAVVAAMRSADARKAAGKSPGSVAMVVYRAIPKTVKDGAIRNGDWVTPSLEYAKLEGESIPGGYRIISLPASAKNLYWDGNSVAEFGYDDGQSYGYKNTKNNRKLLDAVTRDDDGAVIPLSQRFNARNGDVRFSRAGEKAVSADSNARNVATQLLVDGLKAKWTRAPEIIVARNMQDAQIPQAVRDYDLELKSQGATGEPRGFIYKGKVYLLSDQLKGPQQIAEVLFHEVLGHYGLRGVFGKGLDSILQQMGTMRRRDVVAKAREYGLFNKDALGGLDKSAASDSQIWAAMSAKDRLSAAEEVLAEMAQTQPNIGFVQRAIAAIRNWLRAHVPGFERMRLTDADIVQAYILPARGYVTRSNETAQQAIDRAMLAFSRDTNEPMTDNNGGNQGGRSADGATPGAFALAGATVDGLTVRDEIPNQGSIGSSIDDYTVLPGVREIPLAAFTQLPKLKYYSVSEEARTKKLTEQIKASGEINPLIVVIDKDGPYVLEGGHRFDALRELGKTSFPALVALDNDSLNESTAPEGGSAMVSRNVGDALADEAQRVQAAIEGKGLLDAARFLTRSSDKVRASIAQKVLEKLERLEKAGVKLELNIVHRGDMAPAAMANSRGYTETGFDNKGRDIGVWLNGADVTGKVGVEEEVLLHELVHAATTGMVYYGKSIQPNSLAGRHVRDLMAVTDAIAGHITQRFADADSGKATLTEFEQDMRAGANNAFRSDDEVLAWALSNSEAQQYLETIPHKSGSLWSNFVQSVRSLLGLSPASDTALSEVLRVADHLLTQDAPDAGRAAFWHKRGMRMVQQQGQGSLAQTQERAGDQTPTNPDIRFSRATEAAKAAGDAIKSVTVTNIKKKAGFKLTDYLGIGLQALGRRQIVDIYGDMLPLAEYNRLVTQMEADKNEGGAEADQLVTRWAKLPDEAKLADLMHDATLAQIDPAKPYVDGDDKARYMTLQGRFNALSAEAKQVYTDTRDSYQAHHAKVRSAIKERIERSEIKGERKAALLKQMDDEFFAAVKGVYFPLARFGQYAVTVKGADGKVESVSRAETKAEAEALRNSLLSAFPRDKGFTVGRVMLSRDFIADRDAVGRGFMTELYQVLDKQDMDAAQRAELEDTLGQLYLSSLPDLSWAKHGIHRKGTPGFSQDARRAYAQNMFHGSRYLAKLRYSDLMQDELTAMQKHVDDWREVEDFDQNSAQRVVDEMNKRHESLMNPKSNPLSTALTSFGFIFHLGLSPASAMVNLSQTALVAYPIMGAKWGFGKASAALLKASAEATKGKNDITGSLNADERAAYDEAVRAGTIDVTMAHDLAGIAQGEDAGVMWKIRPVMRWASFLFHHAERFNRQVTFVAAYRLARDAGANHKAAFDQATKATYDGHFDYGAANRPRIMQGNVAKVLLLFKQYGQNMVYTLSRSAYQSIKGTDAEKAEARKALAGLLTSHAMAAGVLGLPMVTTLLAAASMIGGDDDEPLDAKVALQNMLADTFGQKPAEVLAHGLSRLTPWDISGRVGLDRLIFPDVQEGLEGQRLAESAMVAALGPVAGIGVNVLKGMQMMGEGRYAMGLEAMMPAALRGPVKALRYAEEGVQDKSGISILDEVSPAAVAGQALGFSPSQARNAQEGKSAVMAHDRALGERRQELLTRAARASMAKDAVALDDARKEIARFNEKNPGRRITPLNVLQSVRNRNKRIDQAQDGVYLPKSRRDAMQAGRFALAESE